tara:strand:- start:4000 stop:4380 length:381 start_codon:yes stop_codon:yes gene_type:complete
MEFPHDIWSEIFSYFHSSYKKPLHLKEYKSIVILNIWNELKSKLQSVIENNYTLYRFIMETTVWTSQDFNLENWYCWMKFLINNDENMYNINISNLKESNKRVYIDFIKILNIYEKEYYNEIMDLN